MSNSSRGQIYAKRAAPNTYDETFLDREFGNIQRTMPPFICRTVTVNTNQALDDRYLLVDATTGARQVTLLHPTNWQAFPFTVKKTDASANAVTLIGTVEGIVNPVLSGQFWSIDMYSDGLTIYKLGGVPYWNSTVSLPVTIPLSAWQYTVIQVPFNGANGGTTFIDQVGAVLTPQAGATTSTAQSVFGGSSGLFNGASITSGNCVETAASYTYNLPLQNRTTPWCLEGWFRTSQAAQQYTALVSQSSSSFEAGAWGLLINADTAGDGKLAFWMRDFSASGPLLKSNGGWNDGAWHHVFVGSNGLTTAMGIDGTVWTSTTYLLSGITPDPRAITFGNWHIANRGLAGYLAEWRILNGLCPYTLVGGASYTVPTAPFPIV
jgi:hypothetical protein